MKRFFIAVLCFLGALWACKSLPPRFSSLEPHKLLVDGEHFKAELSNQSKAGTSYVRFLKKEDGSVVTKEEFLALLDGDDKKGSDFRTILTESLIRIPGTDDKDKGIQFKGPIFEKGHLHSPFYYMTIRSDYKKDEAADGFWEYFFHCIQVNEGLDALSVDAKPKFQKIYGINKNKKTMLYELGETSGQLPLLSASVYFKSGPKGYPASKDTFLVSPCPFEKDHKNKKNYHLTHLRRFLKKIEEDKERQFYFWGLVSKATRARLEMSPHKALLNTEGYAVNYLHFRVESKELYYKDEAQKLLEKTSSEALYKEKFN